MKSLKVRDSMSTNVITFAPNDSVVHAMATLLDKGISGAPVVDEDGSLLGILSEVDLIQVVVQDSYYDDPCPTSAPTPAATSQRRSPAIAADPPMPKQ